MKTNKAILLILDGWGLGQVPSADAILAANTPVMDALSALYPKTELVTYGTQVGLPDGQMGNSEVGHLNIGAGRIVYQELQRINVAIEDDSLRNNPTLKAAFAQAKSSNKKLHLLGLVSDGGVHAHINHIKAICQYAFEAGVSNTFIHAFTDGRDTDPKSGVGYLQELTQSITPLGIKIGSVIGRYYAMDRDKRWERVKVAYDGLVRGIGQRTNGSVIDALQESYNMDITDEFVKPIIACDEHGSPIANIEEGDVVVCFNFRTDRCREITEVLTQQAFPEYEMVPLNLHYVTLTEYDKTFKNVHVIFTNDNLVNTIGETLANQGRKQIRIAETEKYPHVTFFFNGGRELPFEGEQRILIPSPKTVPTYDLKPEMSAREITESILPEINKGDVDFVCLNFANADMVGHTGVWSAAVKAAEVVDECVGKIVPAALENGYGVFIIADHGNSDYLINEDNTPNTAHTTNPVPFILVSNDYKGELQRGKLGDLAPTILTYMGCEIPSEMTGDILIEH